MANTWEIKCHWCRSKWQVAIRDLYFKQWHESMVGDFAGAFSICKCGEECALKVFEDDGEKLAGEKCKEYFGDLQSKEEFIKNRKEIQKPRFAKEQMEVLKNVFTEMGYTMAELVIFEERLKYHGDVEI